MCLMVVHWQPAQRELRVWANRDEFYARPAQSTQFWPEAPAMLAGRDLLKQGAWMGVTRSGRFAAVTNFREPQPRAASLSRGELVSHFLQSSQTTAHYAEQVAARAGAYGGFNLLLCDGGQLFCVDDRGVITEVSAGWHGLSNARLNTPWPKVQRLLQLLPETTTLDDGLLALQDPLRADDHLLPNTGVGIEMERMLSAIYIQSEQYGTRNSTVLHMDAETIRWREREHLTQQLHAFDFARLT